MDDTPTSTSLGITPNDSLDEKKRVEMSPDEEFVLSSPSLACDRGNLQVEPEVEIPDGGSQAWLCAFGSFMMSITCYGVLTSFGAFQEYYSNNILRDHSPDQIGWIGSIELCLVLLMGCISGPLLDRGYLKSQIAFGGGLYVFCLFMTSISTKYYQILLAQGFGVGIAQGIIFTPAMSCLAHHFKRLRVVAFGIFACGASIGGVIFPIALQRLFAQVGFGWAVRIMAFIVLACSISGVLCCSTRLPPRKKGQVLDVRVFQHLPYALLVVGGSVAGLGLYAPISYGVTYATSRGMDSALAFYSISILNASSIIGRLSPSFISHHIGPLNVFIVATFLSTVTLLVWVTATTTPEIIAFDVFHGIFSGAWVACIPASVSALTRDPKETGVRLGMLFFAASFCWLGGAPIQGALIRRYEDALGYWPCAIFSGATVGLGVIFLVLSSIVAKRERALLEGRRSWKV